MKMHLHKNLTWWMRKRRIHRMREAITDYMVRGGRRTIPPDVSDLSFANDLRATFEPALERMTRAADGEKYISFFYHYHVLKMRKPGKTNMPVKEFETAAVMFAEAGVSVAMHPTPQGIAAGPAGQPDQA